MRYIEKTTSPDFFEHEKVNLTEDSSWKDLHCKTDLRLYLIKEQKELCAYCERKIDENNSHIEHIYAQSDNPKLRFEHNNLVASCNGDQYQADLKNDYDPEDINSCGHKKSNEMDENLFLNPIQNWDIEEYFLYNKGNCSIIPSMKDEKKSNYTIKLLNLDNPKLNNERSNARIGLEQAIKNKRLNPKNDLKKLLSKDRPFISFLKYYYSAFL